MNLPKKTAFSAFDLDELEITFRLVERPSLPALDEWLGVSAEVTAADTEALRPLWENARYRIADWNEQELVMFLIAPTLARLNFNGEGFSGFAARELSGVVDGRPLKGVTDWMVASGKRKPHAPYFCLHEYKRSLEHPGDPRAQVLAAMLVAGTLNESPAPVYGAYIIGQFWYFMVLEPERAYAFSKAYDLSDFADFLNVYALLSALKAKITKLSKI